jgi:hypothetical protein
MNDTLRSGVSSSSPNGCFMLPTVSVVPSGRPLNAIHTLRKLEAPPAKSNSALKSMFR